MRIVIQAAARELGQLGFRPQAETLGDGVAIDALIAASVAVDNRLDLRRSLEAPQPHAMADGHAEPAQSGEIVKPAPQRGGAREKIRQGAELARKGRGVENGHDLGAHAPVLQGGQIEQRRAAAEDHPAPQQTALLLEQDLRRAQGDDARQGPALDGEDAIDGPRRQDQGIEGMGLGASAVERMHLPIEDAPDERFGSIVELRPDRLEGRMNAAVFGGFRAEKRLDGKRRIVRGPAIGLSAGKPTLIQEDRPNAMADEDRGRRYARRPSSDDDRACHCLRIMAGRLRPPK